MRGICEKKHKLTRRRRLFKNELGKVHVMRILSHSYCSTRIVVFVSCIQGNTHGWWCVDQITIMAHSMRKEYGEHGVIGFYEKYGSTYRNKHAPEIKRAMRFVLAKFPPDLKHPTTIRVLDLACGSGESTIALIENKAAVLENIDGCDPFTFEAFEEVCGKPAFKWSFEEISEGILDASKGYDLCICSFALHLLDTSKLFGCCYQLALKCKYLLILSPHKRPELKQEMGWNFVFEIVEERIHAKLYQSNLI